MIYLTQHSYFEPVYFKPRSHSIQNLLTTWKRPKIGVNWETDVQASQVGLRGFWGFIEVVLPKIRGRRSWRDLWYASQFSLRPIGDRDWLTGLCWLCVTLASLMRVKHNQFETTIPLSKCCCSQEWRTTNWRHLQVTLRSVVRVTPVFGTELVTDLRLTWVGCASVSQPMHNHRYKLVARPLGMWPQHKRRVSRRKRPDGALWSATISWLHGGLHGMRPGL